MSAEEYICNFEDLFAVGQYANSIEVLVDYIVYDECTSLKHRNLSFKSTCDEEVSDNISEKCQTFLKWVIQQNINISKVMIHLLEMPHGDHGNISLLYNKFYDEIQEIQGMPATKQHLGIEFVTLYNYLVMHLNFDYSTMHEWSEEVWKLFSLALKRAYQVTNGDNLDPFYHYGDTTILQNINIEYMSQMAAESFCCLCFGISLLAAALKKHSIFSIFSKATENMNNVWESTILYEERTAGFKMLYPVSMFSEFDAPSGKDLKYLLMACSKIQSSNYELALLFLDKIICPGWKYVLMYMKAFIIYQEKVQFETALEYSMQFWNEKIGSENWLLAKFSNLIGCCHFQQDRYEEAQKWFHTSMEFDSKFLLPLWNLSCALVNLNKVSAATDILRSLVKKSTSHIEILNDYAFCQFLLLKPEQEMSHIQAVYLLARHYLHIECYTEASNMFIDLIALMKMQKSQILVPYKRTSIPHCLHEIYCEAAYAMMLRGHFEESLRMCNIAECMIPFSLGEDSLSFNSDICNAEANSESNNYKDNLLSAENLDICHWSSAKDNFNCEDEHPYKYEEKLGDLKLFPCDSAKEIVLLSEDVQLENMFFYTVVQLIKASVLHDSHHALEAMHAMNRTFVLALRLLEETNLSVVNFEHAKERSGTVLDETMSEEYVSVDMIHNSSCYDSQPVDSVFDNSITAETEVALFGGDDTWDVFEFPCSKPKNIMSKISPVQESGDIVHHNRSENTIPMDIGNNAITEEELEAIAEEELENWSIGKESSIVAEEELENSNIDKNGCFVAEKELENSKIGRARCLLAEVCNNLAVMCIDCEDIENASHYLKFASKNDPDNLDIIYNCCLLEIKIGNFEIGQNIWITAKQNISIIKKVLCQTATTYPYSVTTDQLITLDDIFLEDDLILPHDISWD